MNRFVSLFAGIGGFDLGFERAGLTCVAQVEIDNAARSVLTRHYPDVPKFADVRSVGKHNLPAADVICGGFPCQDLSVAGKRAGFDGNRSSLFFEMVRIVDELRPAFLIWENVPGLLTSRGGADFWRVLSELGAIGYSGAWTMLDAQWFGLAQRRRRIFGVFARDDIGAARCAEILSLADRLRWHPETGTEKRADVTTAITKSLGAGGADDNDAQGELLIPAIAQCNRGNADHLAETLRSDSHGALPMVFQEQGGFGLRTFDDLAPTLQSEGGTHQGGPSYLPMVFEPRYARNGRGAPDTVAPPLKAENGGTGKGDGAPVVFTIKGAAIGLSPDSGPQYGEILDDSTCYTLNATEQHAVAFNWHGSNHLGNWSEKVRPSLTNSDGHPPAVATNHTYQGDRIIDQDATWPTLPAQGANNGGGAGAILHQHHTGVRRLTPTECERLQGFPDGWTDRQPDSARYRQLGNAVAVPVVEWIARRLMEVSE